MNWPHTELLFPPLPVTLEESHKEIRYLQQQVYAARQGVVQQIENREVDRRAAKGNIESLAEENRYLREVAKLFREKYNPDPELWTKAIQAAKTKPPKNLRKGH